MTPYRLRRAATEDLIRISDFGDEHFGFRQSDKYREKLEAQFGNIARSPLQHPKVDHIYLGFRRCVVGSHTIYYRIVGQEIEIVRVLGRENPENAF